MTTNDDFLFISDWDRRAVLQINKADWTETELLTGMDEVMGLFWTVRTQSPGMVKGYAAD